MDSSLLFSFAVGYWFCYGIRVASLVIRLVGCVARAALIDFSSDCPLSTKSSDAYGALLGMLCYGVLRFVA